MKLSFVLNVQSVTPARDVSCAAMAILAILRAVSVLDVLVSLAIVTVTSILTLWAIAIEPRANVSNVSTTRPDIVAILVWLDSLATLLL
jgi:hypothetical protein